MSVELISNYINRSLVKIALK